MPSASTDTPLEQRTAFERARPLLQQTGDQCGISVFFIAREVRTRNLEKTIAQILDSAGFELLRTVDLDESTAGAYSVNGAPPVAFLIAFDVVASPVEDDMRSLCPDLDNGHIQLAEFRCREFLKTQVPPIQYSELIKASQNSREAWQVIRHASPSDELELRKTIESRKSAMTTECEVVRDLTRLGTRSKIELIRYGQGLAVKKTYRHNCLRFMEREASFMTRFSPQLPQVPPVLERGPNYLIMPFIKGHPLRRFLFGRSFPRLMTLKQARDTADLIRFLLSQGCDPVDLGPHNLLVNDSGGITAIDYEFMHQSDEPVEPERSACLTGLRKGYQGEWPPKSLWTPQLSKCLDPWRRRWFGCTGLTLHSFLYDPPWLQRLKRAVNYPRYLVSRAVERQYQQLRMSVFKNTR